MNDRPPTGAIQLMDNSGQAQVLDSDEPRDARGIRKVGAEDQAGDQGGAGLDRNLATLSTCPIYCGQEINGVTEYCSPGCREACEGFDA